MRAGWSLIGLAGLALAVAGPAAAQGAPGGGGLAELPVTAMQNGRTVASTRTDARGGFQLELAPGAYELCVGSINGVAPNQTRALTLPDRGPRVPGNGGRAGGQALGGAGTAGTGCFPYTAALTGAEGTRRSEPIPVYIRQPDGTIVVGLLAGMRIDAGGGAGPIAPPDRAAAPGGPSGPVRQLPPLPAQAASNGSGAPGAAGATAGEYYVRGFADLAVSEALPTAAGSVGRGGRRVDPRIPPPAVAAPRTVTVIGTLSLER